MKIFNFKSIDYWNSRYNKGGNSGEGSYGKFAEFKAKVINKFVKDNNIKSVVEFGCGDGNQLSYFDFDSYIGLDVAKKSIDLCSDKFKDDKSKSFYLYNPKYFHNNHIKAELTLSLEVIFHIIEDDIYMKYLKDLMDASSKYVIIYSTNKTDRTNHKHFKHRKFSDDIPLRLVEKIYNEIDGESADFYIYEKV